MSQRPPASRPASRSPPDGQRITLPPVQLRDDSQHGGRQEERQQPRQHDGRGYSQILPSPQPTRTPLATTPGEDWRSGRPRDLGVHSILNPSEPEGTPSSSRRVSSGNTESPLSTVGPASHFGVSPTTGTPYTFPSHDTPSSTPPTQEGHHASSPHIRERRIATPRSLVARMNRSGQPPGSIDAQRSPFLPQRARIDSRTFSGEPGQAASSEVPPPMPTPPERSQQQYGFPGPTLDRRISMPTMRAPERMPLSQSASPNIAPSVNPGSPRNYSSSYPGGPPPPSSTPYYPGSTFAPRDVTQQGGGGLQYQGPSASGTEGPYTSAPPPSASMSAGGSSAGSSRQTSASDPVQILTITTSSGVYNVPVDVHQASRLADEKRARNAGASARFRQRRKEKEKEASTTIEKMQSQTRDLERRVREAEQERDFYRGERNRLRDVLYRTPETRHLAIQGPPSPQTIRSSSFHGPASTQAPGPHPPPISFQQEPPPAERPARRRRTSTTGQFQSITYTLPPASTLPPVQASYQGPPQPPTTLPPMRIDSSAPPTSAPSLAPATSGGPPPPPYAPYDPSRSGYERGWPSEKR